MVLFAGGFYFFESAKKLADGDPSSFPNGEWKQIRADSDFASLFTLKFHDDSSGSQIQLQELVNNDTSDQGTPPSQAMSQIPLHVFDAMNVIYHAWKTYHYIAKDCRQSDLLPGTSQAQRIILSIGATQTTDFETGMLPIASGFNTIITFQTDRKGEGFAGNGGRIFTPARDPEVVAHEICHALLWLMDRAPYESRFDGVPFGRALLEGYCTYLARSIYGAIDDESERWASAAYREWGDRWNLGFLGQANADRAGLAALAAPNNYPELETIGLPVYDVGMVWARALWDVRKLLTGMKDKGKISADGAKLADWLALQSYRCVHGWSTGFEAAAEGLIAAAHVIDPMATDVPTSSVNTSSDATIALPDATSEIVKAITEIFAKRGILAQRGVQAIAKVGAQWFAGTDFGLQSADNPIGPWNEVRLDSEAPPGVVGLAAFEGGGNHGALIATERGVYRWQNGAATPIASQDPSVPSVPDPMCSEGILCIAVVDGFAYVGTRRNIWRASVAEGSFRRWTNDSLMAVEGFVHSSNIGGFGPILFFHTPMLIGWTQLTSEPPEWQELLVKDESGEIISLKLISGIQLIDDEHLCVLTVHNGVKRLQLTKTPDGVLIGQIIATSSSGDFTSAKPRCICQNSGHFLVGTTDGIYGTPVGNFGDWTKYARGGDAIITAIAADDTKVVAGTHEDLVKVGSPDVTSTEQWSSLPIHAL